MSSYVKARRTRGLLLAAAVLAATVLIAAATALAATAPQIAPAVNSPGAAPGEITIRAYLNPKGSAVTDCHFAYSLDESFDQSAPCSGVNEVQRLIVRAAAGQFKLELGLQSTGDLPFAASAEEVQGALEDLDAIGEGNVAVTGGVGDPSGASPYRIAFQGALAETDVAELTTANGTVPLSGASGGPFPNSAIVSPITNGDSPYGSGSAPLLVQAHLAHLTPGATYHFRLSATNGSGTESGTDATFLAPAEEEAESCPNEGRLGTDFLPDCRAYELVSPPDKSGGDITPNSQRTRIAADGDAVAFESRVAFGDAIGTGVAVEYEGIRATDPSPGNNGWSTHAITPPQEPLAFNAIAAGADPLYEGDFSTDLDQGVFIAWSPLTDNHAAARAQNLYVRDDLRTPGPGSYRLITECPRCELEGTQVPPFSLIFFLPFYGGASEDFEHIAFEEQAALTPDAPLPASRPHAYEWDDGQLRFAGLIPSAPNTSCGGAGPACTAAAASILGAGIGTVGAGGTPVNLISNDGRRLFFTVPTNGSGTVDPKEFKGRIYVRTAGATTEEITASERTDCAGDPTCGGDNQPDPAPAPYAPAKFEGATPDGSRVFFTSTRPLTDDAVNGELKLYAYDTTKPASDPHNLTLLSPAAEFVIGSGGSGSYVYFTARGQLAPGAPALAHANANAAVTPAEGVYLWHEGRLSFVGESVEPNESAATDHTYGGVPPQGQVSPDGRHLLLSSRDGSGFPGAYDHGICNPLASTGCRELYLYSADTETLACVSCNPSGERGRVDAMSAVKASAAEGPRTTWHQSRALTADGKRVFFTTAEALLPEDTNGVNDVYEYDVPTAQLHLISSGTSSADSYLMEASADGSDVFFVTRERLSGWDTDGSYDLYDARVDGGFPEPRPTTAPCLGDSCRPAATPPPTATAPQSAAFSGPGNPAVRRGCPKGQHKVKTRGGKSRCVKPHKKAHRHHKKAKTKRGAGR